MAELIIYKDRIKENIVTLGNYFKEKNVKWSLITKVFSGNKKFLRNILSKDIIQLINSVGDSRLSSLQNLREVNPEMHTIYIKPPALIYADEVVEYASISLNSSLDTIKKLNEAAKKVGKVHEIIIMIEIGELREGVNIDDTVQFYESAAKLPNIKVSGIGSNLGCMYGIEPSQDKFETLVELKRIIEKKFNVQLELISAGTSITLPLLEDGSLDSKINHFRVGEAPFFGLSPLKNERFLNLHTDTFSFNANIIELEEKKIVPEGTMSDANIGDFAEFDDASPDKVTHKAILDFGIIDVDPDNLSLAVHKDIKFVGITSDMTVIDIGDNQNEDGSQKFKIGDTISFNVNYMAVCRLLNSKFVSKKYVSSN